MLATAAVALLMLPAVASAATERALVLLDPSPPSAAAVRASATAVLARHGLERARPDVRQVGVMTVKVPAGTSFRRFAANLRRDRAVRRVERESRHELRFVPSDPAFEDQDPLAPRGVPFQWYLTRQGFPAAWDLSRGQGVLVGIIDSGIDSSHPELGGKIAIARDQDSGPNGTGDEVGHGTHVAGLACGATDNAAGIAGTGSDCHDRRREERPLELERDRVARGRHGPGREGDQHELRRGPAHLRGAARASLCLPP